MESGLSRSVLRILLTGDSYYSPEQEFVENSIIFSQRRVVSLFTPLHNLRLTFSTEWRGQTPLVSWQYLDLRTVVRN